MEVSTTSAAVLMSSPTIVTVIIMDAINNGSVYEVERIRMADLSPLLSTIGFPDYR